MSTKKILIVEDESPIRRALHDKMSLLSDVVIIEATDGEEGLAQALGQHPDVILLDVMMPKVDGLAMLKTLREDSWGKNVPVLILTNISPNDEKIMGRVIDAEPSYYFVKAENTIEKISQTVQDILAQADGLGLSNS